MASRTPLPEDLGELVSGFAAAMSYRTPYRPPTEAERDEAAAAVLDALAGRGNRALKRFSASEGWDAATGRKYVLVSGAGGWGHFAAEPGAPTRLGVQVPHPSADLRTEELGIALYRQEPGAVLMMAGAHRRAGGHTADVAHREDSVFHGVATGLLRGGVPQIQLHGFDDASSPDADVVVSPGAGEVTARLVATAAALGDAGFATRRSWVENCDGLAGTTNVQGIAAARLGIPFLHLEISRSVRESPVRARMLVAALAAFTRE